MTNRFAVTTNTWWGITSDGYVKEDFTGISLCMCPLTSLSVVDFKHWRWCS